jgi:hypothetical protein
MCDVYSYRGGQDWRELSLLPDAGGMVAATGWRGGFVVLREVKWAVFVDVASEYG